MKDITFQYYPARIKSVAPLGDITLERFIHSVKYPKPHVVHIMNEIRQAAESGNVDRKTELKEKLYFVTPSSYVDGYRNYAKIKHFTGLMPLDFDKLPSREYAEDMKRAFFHTVENVVCAWLSSSGKGFRCLIRIPEVYTVEAFQSHFMAAQMRWGDLKGFDVAPKNAVLPLFISIDYNILYRWDAVEFQDKYIPAKPKPNPVNYYHTGNDVKVFKIIDNYMNSIIDAGHPIVRRMAYYVGGLCAAGHCNAGNALSYMENSIINHPYTGVKAKVKTYLKTCRDMFNKGMESKIDFI